jgi:OOP family OmpA-OmpF porin
LRPPRSFCVWSRTYKTTRSSRVSPSRTSGIPSLEAERYRIDDAVGNKGDVDLYTAGLVFRFGRSEPPPPPPPPPPVRTRVSFSADSLFDFGKDTVKPAGKQALDNFAAELKSARFEVIKVTGYSDRIGSHEYNMRLSTRRAEAVKSYLVETQGIPADKVTAQGADGSDPVTKPDECPGEKRTPKLIACLQPDRRVDVEVVASRLEAAPAN